MRFVRLAALGLVALALAGGFSAAASPDAIQLVSTDSSGDLANGYSDYAAISADGRFVAFNSLASDLVPGDTNTCIDSYGDPYNCDDIFVHDRQSGITERVSVDSGANQANERSRLLAISSDGRYVAFESLASNLVSGDTNGQMDIFVRDRQAGITERASVDSTGNQSVYSAEPAMSADGRFVAFESPSSLVPEDTNGYIDIFVRDRQTGTTEMVSVDSAGDLANSLSAYPAISADGRFVAFLSLASNLVAGDANLRGDIFVHDRLTGATELVSVSSDGTQASSHSEQAAISGDGRFVAFESLAPNLVAGDTNSQMDIFVHDRQTGVTQRVSVDSMGNQANGSSEWPGIDAAGRLVTFHSYASNLVTGDTETCMGATCADVFVHDLQTGATALVSVNSNGKQGNNHSAAPAVSADGRFVAFVSSANNLVAGDINNVGDIFVYDQDPDGDGVLSQNDGDDDGDGYWDDEEMVEGSQPLNAASTPENCDGVDNDKDGTTDEAPAGSGRATPDPLCAASADPDGDTIPNSADTDDDGDGFADVKPLGTGTERGMSTDELAACPASASHDAWPPDRDRDRDADIGDVIQAFGMGKINTPPNYDARSDADGDGDNDIGDVIQLYGMGRINTRCASYTFTNGTGGAVDDIHIVWSQPSAEVYVARDSQPAGWSDRTLSGDGLTLDMDRPDASGDLAAGGTLTVVVRTAAPMLPVASLCRWTLEGVDVGAC